MLSEGSQTQGHVLYDSICIKYPEGANPWKQQEGQRLPGAGLGERVEEWGVTANGDRVSFLGVTKMSWN